MSDTEIADTAAFDLAICDRVLDGLPARQPRLGTTVRAVQQEQVDITEPTSINALLDASSDGRVRLTVASELGRVPDILAFETFGIIRRGQKSPNGFASLGLIVVHLRAVKAAVPRRQAPGHGGEDLSSRHHVEPKLYLGDEMSGWQLRLW